MAGYPMTAPEVVVARTEDFPAVAAARIAKELNDALQRRDHVSLCLSGGSTPRPVYQALGNGLVDLEPDWSSVDVYFGDERCVDPEDPESNFRLVQESLIEPLGRRAPVVNRMEGERQPAEAASRYGMFLPELFDLLVLGVGEDGHTASIFPFSSTLDQEEAGVAVAYGPKPPNPRLTITPPVLTSARRTIILATGAGKADVVQRALRGPYEPRELPIQLATGAVWILDTAAASALGAQP